MPKTQLSGKASDFLKIGVAAAARGDVEAVCAILEGRPGWLTRVGPHGRTMLWEASHRGRLDVVEYLVEGGADIDACGTHYCPVSEVHYINATTIDTRSSFRRRPESSPCPL